MNKILKLTFLFVIAVSLSQIRAQEISFNDLTFEDLNGHSLNEVFRDNIDSLIDTYTTLYRVTYINPNIITTSEEFGAIFKDGSNTGKYYHYYKFTPNNNLKRLDYGNSFGGIGLIDLPMANVTYENSFIETYFQPLGRFHIFIDGYNIGDSMTINNEFRIDMLSLGIENLTVEEMDYYYSLYKQHEGGYTLDTELFGFNVFERFTEFFYIMLEYAQLGMDFLFTTQSIGFEGIYIFGERYFSFNLKFIPFYSITTLAISMTLIYLGKKYIPFL